MCHTVSSHLFEHHFSFSRLSTYELDPDRLLHGPDSVEVDVVSHVHIGYLRLHVLYQAVCLFSFLIINCVDYSDYTACNIDVKTLDDTGLLVLSLLSKVFHHQPVHIPPADHYKPAISFTIDFCSWRRKEKKWSWKKTFMWMLKSFLGVKGKVNLKENLSVDAEKFSRSKGKWKLTENLSEDDRKFSKSKRKREVERKFSWIKRKREVRRKPFWRCEKVSALFHPCCWVPFVQPLDLHKLPKSAKCLKLHIEINFWLFLLLHRIFFNVHFYLMQSIFWLNSAILAWSPALEEYM